VRILFLRALAVLGTLAVIFSSAADSLSWRTNRVDADIQSMALPSLLEQVAAATGWQVYVEPGTRHDTSAKFSNLPPGQALRLLLGDLNFALVPQTNARPRLFVFRTSQGNATQLIRPAAPEGNNRSSKVIPNELIVRLKPGVKIEDLAAALGAKITGRIDALNTYRLEFADETATRAAREKLLDNPDVAAIDSDYVLDRPPPPGLLANGRQPNWYLEPKENSGPCRVTIGLIDTSVAPSDGLAPFLLPAIAVADNAPSPAADFSHGTAMAQAILESVQTNISGSKTAVKILPVDVYGVNPNTSTFDVGEGIYRAVTAGANIINLSLGGSGDSPFLHGLITSASKQGVVFFGAAGNEPVTSPVYPAAYPEVIAVTASDPNGRLASYANHGTFVSIMAPGTSLANFQGQAYLVTGTSSAAALATGFAAGLADSQQNCPDQVIPAIRSKLGVKFEPAP
jgi:hypothetical protein